jgi:hypothetical protein
MKDPVRIFGCGRGFHLLIATAWRGRLLCEPCDCAGLTIGERRNDCVLPVLHYRRGVPCPFGWKFW